MPSRPLLSYIPPPLLNDLVSGRWLPVVGAGLSRNARTPPGTSGVPDWNQLGEELGRELPQQYRVGTPLEVISAYEHAFGRAKLVERVMRALHVRTAMPGAVHDAFCALPFDAVVTTNVEHLLETAYRRQHGAVLAVTEEEQLRLGNPYDGPTLVKFHGDLHHPDSLILTERDYDRFMAERPLFITWLAHQLIVKTGVFVGYSLDDADFRQLLQLLRSRLGSTGLDLYTIGVGVDPVQIDRYERRGVRVINLPRTTRGYEILSDLFEELSRYWREYFKSRLTGTTATVRALIRAGQRVESAILFLVPDEHQSIYDEFVFPLAVDRGMIPVTRQDVSSPYGYNLASIEALLAIAGRVVVQTDDPEDPLLLRATTELGTERVTRVGAASARAGENFIEVPHETTGWEAFGALLIEVVAEIPAERSSRRAQAPSETFEMLMDEGRLREAVLIGVVEAEALIRRLLRISRADQRRLGFTETLLSGKRVLELPLDDASARALVVVRNQLVHGSEAVPEPELRHIASVLGRLLTALRDARDDVPF